MNKYITSLLVTAYLTTSTMLGYASEPLIKKVSEMKFYPVLEEEKLERAVVETKTNKEIGKINSDTSSVYFNVDESFLILTNNNNLKNGIDSVYVGITSEGGLDTMVVDDAKENPAFKKLENKVKELVK